MRDFYNHYHYYEYAYYHTAASAGYRDSNHDNY